jgi:hypothetical protein
MKKGFCLKRTLTTILILLLFGGTVYLAVINFIRTNELNDVRAEQKALQSCIKKCNKLKKQNSTCSCIVTGQELIVY